MRLDSLHGADLVETDLAIDPSQPRRVAIAVRDVSGMTGNNLDGFFSRDGGATWTGRRVASGRYAGAGAETSDPTIAFDAAGRAFYGALAIRFFPERTRYDSVIGVQRSLDGGASYASPRLAARSSGPGLPEEGDLPPGSTFNDKEWLAVDRSGGSRDGTLYVAWDAIHRFVTSNESTVAITSSSDHGATFARPRVIGPRAGHAFGPQMAVLPDGTLVVVWVYAPRDEDRFLPVLAVRSTDGGRTFSTPRRIASIDSRGANAYYEVALDASAGGRLLACWSTGAGRGMSQATCTGSADGVHWDRSVRIAPRVPGAHDLVAVSADADHPSRFWAAFYAVRPRATTVRLYRSDDDGRSFGFSGILARRPYPAGSFLAADSTLFTGDYIGLDARGGQVIASYVLPRRSNMTGKSVYVTALPSPGAPAPPAASPTPAVAP